jgi:acetylornithine deacetylase/succinyl-diaminopimelate desuccinylase-like protein
LTGLLGFIDLKELLQQLVKIRSVSGNEDELSEFIFSYLEKLQLAPIRQDGNILIHFKGTTNKALIFNAHIDTVNPGAIGKWIYPPFGERAGEVKEDKLYGLGASDNKSSIAVLLKLCEWTKENKPDYDIWFSFTVKEEVDGSGTQSFVNWLKRHDYLKNYDEIQAVVCEPRSCKEISLGNKGNIFIRLIVTGETGHSARKHQVKRQAILEGVDIVRKLDEIEKKVNKKFYEDDFGPTTIAVTSFKSDEGSPNIIPAKCEITLDIRTVTKTHGRILDEIKEGLKEFDVKMEYVYQPKHPVRIPQESRIVQFVRKNNPELKISLTDTGNDSVFFMDENIPAIVFGPGNKEQSHKENEFVELKNLDVCLEMFKNLAKGIYSE